MKKVLLFALLLSGIAHAENIKLSDAPTSPVETVRPAVVELHIVQQAFDATAERRRKKKVQNMAGHSVCSGVFIDDLGDILTAGHCAQGASSIEVVLYNNQTYEAVVVATSSIHDLALLHVDKLHTPYIKPANDIVRGDTIFILGSPLAITDTLSTGIIAKLMGDLTLVDCSALPGNSGSPVFNTKGELVGILTAGFIVGLGTTHLNVVQSLDAVYFFVMSAFQGRAR